LRLCGARCRMPTYGPHRWGSACDAHVPNWHILADEIDTTAYGSKLQPWLGDQVGYAFARASAKYYLDEDGLIKSAANNVLRPEWSCAQWPSFNNFLRSEELDNASWSKVRCSIDSDSIANPLDGEMTADIVIEDNSAGTTHFLRQGFYFAENTQYTASAYFKPALRNWMRFYYPLPSGLRAGYFDFRNGVVGITNNLDDSAIEDVGSGWYRCSITFTTGAGDGGALLLDHYIAEDDNDTVFDGQSTDSFYAYGFQMNLGATAQPYTGTGAAVAGTSDGAYGWAYDKAATNLLLRSEEFDNAAWNKVRATCTANQIVSPVGDLTADSFNEDNTLASEHYINQGFAGAAGTYYTVSVFVKRGNRTWIRFYASDSVTDYRAFFDVENGAVGTTLRTLDEATIIQPYPNGWYRCVMCFKSHAAHVGNIDVRYSVGEADNDIVLDGLNQVSLYLWGAQVETGFISAYIPTVAAPVARVRDDETIPCNIGVEDNSFYCKVAERVPANWNALSVGPLIESTAGLFTNAMGIARDGVVAYPAVFSSDGGGLFDFFYFTFTDAHIGIVRDYLLQVRTGVPTPPQDAESKEDMAEQPLFGTIIGSSGTKLLGTDLIRPISAAATSSSCIKSLIAGG